MTSLWPTHTHTHTVWAGSSIVLSSHSIVASTILLKFKSKLEGYWKGQTFSALGFLYSLILLPGHLPHFLPSGLLLDLHAEMNSPHQGLLWLLYLRGLLSLIKLLFNTFIASTTSYNCLSSLFMDHFLPRMPAG